MSTLDHHTELFASSQRVSSGHSLSLGWDVTGSGVAVLNVQLACAGENGLEVIESVPEKGIRQMIIIRPGIFTFTLTAAFGDGVKRTRQIQIRVED